MGRILNQSLVIDTWNEVSVPGNTERYMWQFRSNVATAYVVYEEPPAPAEPPVNLDCWSYKANDIIVEEDLSILSGGFKFWVYPSVDGVVLEMSVWGY